MITKEMQPKKQDYHRPQVRDYGGIKAITANSTGSTTADAGASTRKT
jgi:hypothetical protein